MHLITRQSQASTAAARWSRQYKSREGPGQIGIGARLADLGPTPDPDSVDRIVGNTSWTCVPKCDECGTRGLSAVVQLGEPPDCESSTANICGPCLKKALAIVTW